MEDKNRIMLERAAKAALMREQGQNPYANDFKVSHTLAGLRAEHGESAPDMSEIPEDAPTYRVAGRVMGKNDKGKIQFLRIRDRSCTEEQPVLQLFVRKNDLGDETYAAFKKNVDVGDIVACEGPVFRTRRGELSILPKSIRVLTKSIRPLPEKFHGLTDVETRFRQRYVDLIMNMDVREVFRARSKVISHIRRFFEDREFMEVETPMMAPLAGGAAARPFKTWHNALSIDLYMRIAPELYLKRLVVGGFERVYELNRNFRNEGMSPKHNPEFTMLEFYWAYADYTELMDLTEDLFSELCHSLHGSTDITWGENELSLAKPFRRLTMEGSLHELADVPADKTGTLEGLHAVATERGVHFDPKQPYGKMLLHLFEELVEPKLIQPTFITKYPLVVSPLSRMCDDAPEWVDRFELFIGGNEIANGFSELNDPEDQHERFQAQLQAKADGDDEAHPVDSDYVRALEYGMPPAAGEGIGIDRLVMMLTNQQTIREVILFPHMRPEGAGGRD